MQNKRTADIPHKNISPESHNFFIVFEFIIKFHMAILKMELELKFFREKSIKTSSI